MTKQSKRAYTAQASEPKASVSLTVRTPTQKEVQASDRAFKSAYTSALMDGLPTRSVLLKRLEENGLWSPTDRAEFTAFRNEYITLKERADAYRPGQGTSEEDHADLLARIQTALTSLNSKRADIETMLQYTADAQAEEAKTVFLAACTTEKAEGGRYFSSTSDMTNSSDQDLVERIKYEYITFSNGVESQWDSILNPPKSVDAPSDPAPAEKSEPQAATPSPDSTVGDVAAVPVAA